MYSVLFNSEDLVNHQAIGVIIKNSKNEVLMLYHNKHRGWTVPVGKVKPTQTVVEALLAEVDEETTLKLKDFNFLFKFDFEEERNGNNIKIVTHVFECSNWEGAPINVEKEKHSELKWMCVEDILHLNNVTKCGEEVQNYLRGN